MISELKAFEVTITSTEQVYIKSEADKVIAELQEEIRRINRALWVTRSAFAKSEKDRWISHIDIGAIRNRKDPAYIKTGKLLDSIQWRRLWGDNERKCRVKAEEFK